MSTYLNRPRSLQQAQQEADASLELGLGALTYAPSRLLEGIAAPQQGLFGALSEGSEGAYKGFFGEQTYDFEDVRSANPELDRYLTQVEEMPIDRVGYPRSVGTNRQINNLIAENTIDPVVMFGAGTVNRAKSFVEEAIKKYGSKEEALRATAQTPDNLLGGFYGGPLDRAGAIVNFVIDSGTSAMKSMDPKAIETYKKTNMNPVLLRKLKSFVQSSENLKEESKELEEKGRQIASKFGTDSFEYKEHKNFLNKKTRGMSLANKRIEGQVQHFVYTDIRSGVDFEDMSPLGKAMLDKMTVKKSGAQDLTLENYKKISSGYNVEVSRTGQKLRQETKATEKLFDTVLKNWGVKNPEKYKLLVRKDDNENPFMKDVGPVVKTIGKAVFKEGPFKDVDSLYKELTSKQQSVSFIEKGIGLKKAAGNTDKETFSVFGRDFYLGDVGVRKADEGVYISITGNPAFSTKELINYVNEKNAINKAFNEELTRKNSALIQEGKEPLKQKMKPVMSLTEKKKEVDRLRKKFQSKSGGVISKSILEGGVNFEMLVKPNGQTISVISDDYNFLENLAPSVENTFKYKILGVTPPMKLNALEGGFAEHRRPKLDNSLIKAKDRNEMIKELEDLGGGEVIPEPLRTGMLGASLGGVSLLDQIEKDEK